MTENVLTSRTNHIRLSLCDYSYLIASLNINEWFLFIDEKRKLSALLDIREEGSITDVIGEDTKETWRLMDKWSVLKWFIQLYLFNPHQLAFDKFRNEAFRFKNLKKKYIQYQWSNKQQKKIRKNPVFIQMVQFSWKYLRIF